MTLHAQLYFSFRSPYSALAIGRYYDLAAGHDLNIAFKPVCPLAIRQPDFFKRSHPNWLRYTLLDVGRVAAFEGVPFGMPCPDPIIQNMETGEIAPEQPYIRRVTRMGQAAARQSAASGLSGDNRALDFARRVAKMIWGGVENWHEGGHLLRAAEDAGLDTEQITDDLAQDAEALDQEIAANQDALEAAGHWGVPTLVFEGEPFFGQDRVAVAEWRMRERGLAPLPA